MLLGDAWVTGVLLLDRYSHQKLSSVSSTLQGGQSGSTADSLVEIQA